MAALDNIYENDNPVLVDRNRSPNRLNRINRKVAAGIGILAFAGFSVGIYEGTASAEVRQPLLTYVAKPGDTLSAIAERITHAHDVRPEVFDIEQHVDLNADHTNPSMVQAGDKVLYHPDGTIVDYVERP